LRPSFAIAGLFRAALIVAAALSVSGCGALNAGLSSMIADNLPQWAGGLPREAPPRPGDPRYAEFEREQLAKTQMAAHPASSGARVEPAVLRQDEGEAGASDAEDWRSNGRGLH